MVQCNEEAHVLLNLLNKLRKKDKMRGLWFDNFYIENTRGVSFDIKFTRQGFENTC